MPIRQYKALVGLQNKRLTLIKEAVACLGIKLEFSCL